MTSQKCSSYLVVVTHHRMNVQKSKALGLGLCVLQFSKQSKFELTIQNYSVAQKFSIKLQVNHLLQ